jgi:hypothetical protein
MVRPAAKPITVGAPSRRRTPVLATRIPSRLAAEIGRTDDRLANPATLTVEARTNLRNAVGLRLASFAQRVVTASHAAARGDNPDALCDCLEELNACASESLPWLRAARGERGAL